MLKVRGPRVLAGFVAAAVMLATLRSPSTGRAQYPGLPGRLAFVRSPTSASPADLYTSAADGSDLRKISTVSGGYGALDWSADGRHLAFEKANGGVNEVWVVGADGSDPRRVSPQGLSRFNPSWSPDGRYLAVDDGGSIYRIDTVAGHEQLLRDPGVYEAECLDVITDLPVYYSYPSWSPDGARIALIAAREFEPLEVFDTCDPNPNIKFDLGVMLAGGGEVSLLTDDPDNSGERFDALPDWSPDGTKIAWMRGNASTTFGIAVMASSGGPITVLANGFGARPRWSPDGERLLITRDQNGDGKSDLWTMDAVNGSGLQAVVKDSSHNLFQDWQPRLEELEVTLDAFAPDGTPLSETISMAQTITVTLTITNTGDQELREFEFASDEPLVIDGQSTGGLEIVSGPDPVLPSSLTLQPGEEVEVTFEVETTADGIAAAHTKVTAKNEDDIPSQDFHSLRFDIADGAELSDELGRWAMMQAIDQFLNKSFRVWHEQMAARGQALASRLRDILSPAQQLQWFGSLTELPISALDRATARLRGVAPEMVAASTPKQDLGDATLEELNRAYDQSFRAELGKGVSEWVTNWAELGSSVKKGLEDSYGEALLTSLYVFGNATPEERAQFEAYAMTLMDGVESSSTNVVNTLAKELPEWQANLEYLDEALDLAVADAFLLSPDLQAAMAAETEWRQNTLELAATDPLGFQQAFAQRDAEIASLGIPLVFDTLLGGGVFKAGGALGNVVLEGKAAAMMRLGRATGVVDAEGVVTKGAKTAIKPSTSSRPSGASLSDVAEAERSGGYLDKIEGATIVQSSDAGKVYELPNLGGVPEVTLEAKAGILADLESEYLAATGKQIKVAEVLKPSSALRKVDGVAKLELTPQKTGKPAMLDAGAPKEVLAEASVWRSGTNPADLPGFRDLSKVRQKAALAEWRKANEAWEEWINPPPGSKTARLKECIGQRSRVPLDSKPNVQGIQRFVTAEFEEVAVVQGDAEARLIRAKYYEIEVVDTKTGQTLNKRTVLDAPEAVPQTPDADAVALGKVVGADEFGHPIIEPFTRAEREFMMQRYIDKNIKARKLKPGTKGAIPDAAEHGVTLVMDDASASVAGKLLGNYGIPFLPKKVGLALIKRIAPFVSKAGATPAQIAATRAQLLAAIRSQGGFGQHAVVVTADSRYLGEIPFASW